MNESKKRYWQDCISDAAEECGLVLTPEQLESMTSAVYWSHDCMDQAFYEPPPSDRLSSIEKEWKSKLAKLQGEFDAYRNNAETAVKKALDLYHDSDVRIEEHGSVFLIRGSTEQIQ